MSQPAVIDTNVVVSGILRQSDSPTARIVDAMLSGAFRYLISVELLAEYRAVLLRPKISRKHGLSPSEVDVILTELAAGGAVVEVDQPSTRSARKDDEHLWRILAGTGPAYLVTGDEKLFERTPERQVLSPREFLLRIEPENG